MPGRQASATSSTISCRREARPGARCRRIRTARRRKAIPTGRFLPRRATRVRAASQVRKAQPVRQARGVRWPDRSGGAQRTNRTSRRDRSHWTGRSDWPARSGRHSAARGMELQRFLCGQRPCALLRWHLARTAGERDNQPAIGNPAWQVFAAKGDTGAVGPTGPTGANRGHGSGGPDRAARSCWTYRTVRADGTTRRHGTSRAARPRRRQREPRLVSGRRI